MSDSENKDKILAFLNDEKNSDGFFQLDDLNKLIFAENPLTVAEIRRLVEDLTDEGHLTGSGSRFKAKSKITSFLEKGGYTGEEAQRKSKAERERVSDQKAMYELKLAKWQVNVFWPAFLFTLVGSILGIISFYLQVRK
jgi:hypothetical protein